MPLKKLPFFLENPVVGKNGAKFYNSLNSTQRLLLFDFLLQLISKICEELEFKSVLNLFLLVLTITVSCVFKVGPLLWGYCYGVLLWGSLLWCIAMGISAIIDYHGVLLSQK